ncbi:amidohydrolase family protein [Candidatus Latescibacterota bacterium]
MPGSAVQCVRAKTIYTGKTVAKDAYIIFDGPKVVAVSKTKRGKQIGECAVITPAFIDGHSHIGMSRAAEPQSESEANEHLDPVMPLPDALDTLQLDDPSFADAIEMGVLYSSILPGSGNIIAGRSAVIRHYAADSTQALIARAGIKAAFGHNPRSTQSWKGLRPSSRMGALAILRAQLDEVQQKEARRKKARGAKRDEITFGAGERVLLDLLTGKDRLRAHIHKIDDIATVLRLCDEYKLKLTVEHAMDVHEPAIFAELKKRRVPVVYGPLDSFAYKVELRHKTWRNIRHLLDSGVEFGIMTDHPVTPSRSLLLTTRWFVRNGLSKQQAIEIISRRNARILGVDGYLGSLEKGKWASFSCWNGDPFDLAHFPVVVYGEGEAVYTE